MIRSALGLTPIVILLVCLSNCGGDNTPAWMEPTSLEAATIKSEYDKLKKGMTYSEVWALLGPGRFDGQTAAGEYRAAWAREGAEGGGGFVTFDSGGSVVGYYWANLSRLIPFEMRDQFDDARRDTELRGRVAIFLVNGQKTRSYGPAWRAAVDEEFADETDTIAIVGVAEMKFIPEIMRGLAIRSLPSEKDRWVLLDWNDTIADAYGLDMEKCNILVFDREGNTVYQVAVTEVDDAGFDVFVQAVRNAEASGEAGPA